MESKGGKKMSSSKSSFYEAPLGYSIEDIRPNGGIKKFRSAAYSNVCANSIANTLVRSIYSWKEPYISFNIFWGY